MTEHTNEHAQKAEHHKEEPKSGRGVFEQRTLALSIIIGSVLICASIFYNTKVVLTKLDGGLGTAKLAGTGAQVQQQQQQQAAAPAPQDDGKPVTVPDRKDQPTIGKSTAKVTMVAFSDFQCPFCARFYNDAYKSLKTKYIDTGKLKFVYRHFALPFHNNAQKAAEAAECANRQGKFESYYKMLFEKGQADGTGLAVADLKAYADQLGLNKGTLGFKKNQFNQCLDNGETTDVVKKDSSDGSSLGVSGTPTLFINGKKIVGAQPVATFEQAIDEALK